MNQDDKPIPDDETPANEEWPSGNANNWAHQMSWQNALQAQTWSSVLHGKLTAEQEAEMAHQQWVVGVARQLLLMGLTLVPSDKVLDNQVVVSLDVYNEAVNYMVAEKSLAERIRKNG